MTDPNETANLVAGITGAWREHLAEEPRSARSPTTRLYRQHRGSASENDSSLKLWTPTGPVPPSIHRHPR